MSDTTNCGLNDIVITAMGAVTAVGGNVEQTVTAINAGITPFEEHAYYECTPDDPEWDEDLPAYVAAAPFIEPFLNNIDRFTQLAIPALTEVFANSLIKRSSLPETGLFVALPVIDKSILDLPLNEQWLTELRRQTGLVSLINTQVTRNGSVGVFSLINEAIDLLQSGQLNQCIVGGVDSYLLESRMKHFDQLWRVKSTRNVDGFIPGEASIMLMLETKEHAASRGADVLAKVGGVGFGVEPNNFNSERASSGQGLTQAIKAALESSSANEEINTIACDLNGESYYSQELGLIQTRLGIRLNSVTEISHPADCCGSVGAASGALLIAVAISDLLQQKDKSKNILLSTANDDGRRSALIVKSA